MTQGGAALPVIASTDPPAAGPALRVAVVSDGRAVQAGPAQRVVVVSDGRPSQGNPPIPVVVASAAQAGRVLAGPPIPVVVVSGSLDPNMIYTNKVKALSPIAYWPLADASGATATDESGNARNGTYSNVTLGATGIGDGRTAATFNGTTSFTNVYSTSLRDAFNGQEGSLAFWAKVSGAGIWTDATARIMGVFLADANNFVQIRKSATNNTIDVRYSAGGTAKSVAISTSATAFLHIALTWSKSNDQMIAYLNGVQIGSTQTGLGTFSGSIASTTTVIGANTTTPTNVYNGTLAHAAIWTSPLSAAQIASLATL